MEKIVQLDPLLRESEVARMLEVTKRVIRRARYAGKLPWVRIGKDIRIKQSDLFRYLEAQERGCPAQTPAPALSAKPDVTSGTSSDLSPAKVRVESQRARQIAQRLNGF